MLEGRQSGLASDFLSVAGEWERWTVEGPGVGIIVLGHVGKMMQRIFPGAVTYDRCRPGGSAFRPGEGTPGPAGGLPALAALTQLPAGHHFRSGGHA